MPTNPYDAEEVAPRFRAIMKWGEYEHSEMAVLMGYAPPQLSAVFRAEHVPNRRAAYRVWQATQISPAWSIYGLPDGLAAISFDERARLLALVEEEAAALARGEPPQRKKKSK